MPRYKLTIEYEGNRFSGWQRQRKQTSVQSTIEDAIKALFDQDVIVEGAGRTDAGVHALGQVAHVDLNHDVPGYRLCDGLNHYLRNRGVVILKAEEAAPDFHARFSATGRVYEYRIYNRRAPLVLEANQAWHVIAPLDVEKMIEAAKHLVGHHDFTSFRATRCQANSPVRTLDAFDIRYVPMEGGGYIIAEVASRSFLHNQVRIMMGTLKRIGEGCIDVDMIPTMLEARDRRLSGPTAPPQGLYLKSIAY
ncbi:MAG: tRNA pseudouridine(38-40) synthase TruA [Alphaproteobacteria bacterium]|jgi:tRNA pseudouridine38-40 synthase|nr:tRNA pseudouridine(38-40) synthase TruA [Alphaproteobacteria bacterium]